VVGVLSGANYVRYSLRSLPADVMKAMSRGVLNFEG
jgi:hypothetical protein